MLLWLAIGAALGYAAVRIGAGYPSVRGFRVLTRQEVAFLDAAGDAMYPPGGPLPPSGSEARVSATLDGYLEIVPPTMRRLMRLLFFLMEHATLVFAGPPPRGRRRFSSLSREQREAVLEGWHKSGWFPRRLVFTSLRALLTNAYVADPAVLRHLGLTPFSIETPVSEADLLYPPIGRPRSAIRHARLTAPSDGAPLDPRAPRHAGYREAGT
jgi:hypothetical protein